MTETAKLLRLFRVDQQLGGLQGRLRSAERFLETQERALGELNTQRESLVAQLRQLKASAAGDEGDANTIGARIDDLRGKMNESSSNKEYQALLVEVGKLSADKSVLDEKALGVMEKCDEVNASVEALDAQIAERKKMKKVAAQDRDKRDAEIADRVQTLKGERAELAKAAAGRALAAYEARRKRFDDAEDVMAPLEEQNVKKHEFTCGSCMMGVPVNLVSSLVMGKFTTCTSCGVILYLDESSTEKLVAMKR